MNIWIVDAESPDGDRAVVPCATQAVANDQAAEFVEAIRVDSRYGSQLPPATAENWEDVLENLQDVHGVENCLVEITEEEVRS